VAIAEIGRRIDLPIEVRSITRQTYVCCWGAFAGQ
jgi:hypothetical protein